MTFREENTKETKDSTRNLTESFESQTHENSPLTHPLTAPLSSNQKKKGPTTRVTIKYDVGFPNSIYIRGKGANLNWNKGIPLKNVKHDEWIWETDVPFTSCEFKVLINDKHYENGENHHLNCGATIQYTPKFSA